MPSTRSIRPWLAILSVLALGLAGCNGDDAPPDNGPAGEAAEVTAENVAFQPESLTVSAGSTVAFTNRDNLPHTATAGQPGAIDEAFKVDLPSTGSSGDVTFEEAGTFVYFCEVHPTMTGEIIVE